MFAGTALNVEQAVRRGTAYWTLHNPVADKEYRITLIEKVSAQHTGDPVFERSVAIKNQPD